MDIASKVTWVPLILHVVSLTAIIANLVKDIRQIIRQANLIERHFVTYCKQGLYYDRSGSCVCVCVCVF